jgi:hypothetical protein
MWVKRSIRCPVVESVPVEIRFVGTLICISGGVTVAALAGPAATIDMSVIARPNAMATVRLRRSPTHGSTGNLSGCSSIRLVWLDQLKNSD